MKCMTLLINAINGEYRFRMISECAVKLLTLVNGIFAVKCSRYACWFELTCLKKCWFELTCLKKEEEEEENNKLRILIAYLFVLIEHFV